MKKHPMPIEHDHQTFDFHLKKLPLIDLLGILMISGFLLSCQTLDFLAGLPSTTLTPNIGEQQNRTAVEASRAAVQNHNAQHAAFVQQAQRNAASFRAGAR